MEDYTKEKSANKQGNSEIQEAHTIHTKGFLKQNKKRWYCPSWMGTK